MSVVRSFGFIGLLSVLLAGCGGGTEDSSKQVEDDPILASKKWTYMVYMAADNSLSPAAETDLNEMEMVGSTGDVNIVAMVEFNPALSPSQSKMTQRGMIRHDTNLSRIVSLKSLDTNVDMADKQTLESFVMWAKKHYPADHYALVLWSHGDGWRSTRLDDAGYRGSLYDSTARTYMSLSNIREAIKQAGGVNLIDFDACLMGMYEVAFELKDVAQGMIASAGLVSNAGNPYTPVLQLLTQQPDLSPAVFGRRSAEMYVRHQMQDELMSKAYIDLNTIDQIQERITQVIGRLLTIKPQFLTEIRTVQQTSYNYSGSSGHLDMKSLLNQFKLNINDVHLRDAIDLTVAQIDATVVSYRNVQTRTVRAADSQNIGLAIYFPDISQTSLSALINYQSLMLNQNESSTMSWGGVLDELLRSHFDSHSLIKEGGFSYQITWGDAAQDLDLMVLEPKYLYHADGQLTENGSMLVDSKYSGYAEEMYTANLDISPGNYDLFVRYYNCNEPIKKNCPPVTVSVWFKDPRRGIHEFTLLKTITLDFSQTATASQNMDVVNALIAGQQFSDWTYILRDTRGVQISARNSKTNGQNQIRGGDFTKFS